MFDEQIPRPKDSNNLGERLAAIIGSSEVKAGTADPTKSSSASAVDSSMWFIIHAGVQSGPFSLSQLVLMVAAGDIKVDDLAKQGDGLWKKAIEIGPLQDQLRQTEQETKKSHVRFDGVWLSKKGLLIGVSLGLIILVLGGVLVLQNAPRGHRERTKAEEKRFEAEEKRFEAEEKRIEADRNRLETQRQEYEKLSARARIVDLDAWIGARLANDQLFSKVRTFVNANPRITFPGSASNTEWELATRPFRTSTELKPYERDYLLDFLGRAMKHAPHNVDASFSAVIADLKQWQFYVGERW